MGKVMQKPAIEFGLLDILYSIIKPHCWLYLPASEDLDFLTRDLARHLVEFEWYL